MRDRSLRGGRKHRHAAAPAPAASKAVPPAPDPGAPSPGPGSDTGAGNGYGGAGGLDDGSCGGSCTEEQLEEILLKNLDMVYREALARLVSLGYDEDTALRAILCSGHCYGSMDVLSNILHNAIAHLNSPSPPPENVADAVAGCGGGFTDLRHLQEYSLAGMVCLLQQVRPGLTRSDAMWSLLASELHVGRASTIDIPPSASGPGGGDLVAPPPAGLCRLHAAAAAGHGADLPPSVRSILRRNAAMFSRPRPRPQLDAAATESSTSASEPQLFKENHSNSAPQDSDLVDSLLKSLESMSLEEGEDGAAEDPKKEMILDLIRQIRELEVQVKERKEWAQQKALQAARKLSADLTELRILRMEHEDNQRIKGSKQVLDDTTVKRLADVEAALKKASGQVDRANTAVRRLEQENAEVRAEIQASKLSASESVRVCLEVERREKKSQKKLLAWEKQREKLQEEIAEERRKVAEAEQQLRQVREATKATELKWKQETESKEKAIAQAEEERRAKEAAEANVKRRQEALRQKIELDYQRHKDDIQRLEEELSRVRASAGSTQLNNLSAISLSSGDVAATKALREANGKVLTRSTKPQETSKKLNRDRECTICKKEEVSVVFLPCAHQVLCANCNEDHEKDKTSCPCCKTKIEQRIHVYGVSS